MEITVKSDAYHVVMSLAHPISLETLRRLFTTLVGLDSREVEEILAKTVKSTGLYLWRLMNVAKRFGIITKEASLKELKGILKSIENTIIGLEALKEVKTYDLDTKALLDFINSIKREKVNLVFIESKGEDITPFSKETLNTIQFMAFLQVAVNVPSILDMIKKRLFNTRVKLVCLMCGKWSIVEKVGNLPERIVCPKCGSGFITITKNIELDLESIVKRRLRKGKLVGEEKAIFEEARKTADLVLTYGKKAVIALAAKGVGPRTAAKIISKLALNEREFYKAIVEAEKNYLRTRMYWD